MYKSNLPNLILTEERDNAGKVSFRFIQQNRLGFRTPITISKSGQVILATSHD